MTAPAVGERVTPTGVFLGRWEVGTPDWHAVRRVALGGSEIAAVLGLSPWESRFSLWHRKIGAIGEQVENPEMEWGKRLEPVLLGKFLDNHDEYSLGPCGTFVHADRRWQLANPDALLLPTDGGLPLLWEGKVSRDSLGWGEDGSDQVPPYYEAQVLHYLDVLGLQHAVLSVLIAGQDYREYHLTFKPERAAELRDAGAEFMRTLADRERPDIDAHSETYQAVRDLHPDIDPVDVEIPVELAEQYRQALAGCRAADDAKTEATARVADALGRGRRAVCLGERIALRIPGRGDNPPFLRPDAALSKALR